MEIRITNRQRARKIDVKRLKSAIQQTLDWQKVERADIGVRIVGEVEMTRLNETYLQHAGATDVITFDYSGAVRLSAKRLASRRHNPIPAPPLFGEIVVCLDEAILQAKKFRCDWRQEILRYVVHGILHLLGHEDLHVASRRRMKLEENRIMRLLRTR